MNSKVAARYAGRPRPQHEEIQDEREGAEAAAEVERKIAVFGNRPADQPRPAQRRKSNGERKKQRRANAERDEKSLRVL
jgi:hypothetical protein